jgi:hypothetical protein
MRRLSLMFVFALVPVGAYAQPVAYIEGSVGVAFMPNVSTQTYTFFIDPYTISGHGELDYGTNLVAGAEIGYAGFAHGQLRWGLSYDYMHATLESASLVGSVNGVPGSIKFSSGELNGAGFNFDNSVHLITTDFYYNFADIGGVIRPYVGVGVGAALIEHADAELALSGTAGFRYGFADNTAYIGVRYRYYRISGPTDDFGIKYDPIQAHTVSAVLGFYLE